VALPLWESWLARMRAAAKEALEGHPTLNSAQVPGDECAQYALLECVWLFDRRGQPWLIATHGAPNLFPASNVDRYVKESVMKDLYALMIAPIIEEAAPDAGSFVPL
jgi:hypothetical protein